MRYKSEETMEQIKKAVEDFYFANRRSPSISEIAAEVGCARSTVHSYLWEMDKRRMLSYLEVRRCPLSCHTRLRLPCKPCSLPFVRTENKTFDYS